MYRRPVLPPNFGWKPLVKGWNALSIYGLNKR